MRGSKLADASLHAPAHERFISDLIKHNVILLGGELDDLVGDAQAAYVLRSSLEEARASPTQTPLSSTTSCVLRVSSGGWWESTRSMPPRAFARQTSSVPRLFGIRRGSAGKASKSPSLSRRRGPHIDGVSVLARIGVDTIQGPTPG